MRMTVDQIGIEIFSEAYEVQPRMARLGFRTWRTDVVEAISMRVADRSLSNFKAELSFSSLGWRTNHDVICYCPTCLEESNDRRIPDLELLRLVEGSTTNLIGDGLDVGYEPGLSHIGWRVTHLGDALRYLVQQGGVVQQISHSLHHSAFQDRLYCYGYVRFPELPLVKVIERRSADVPTKAEFFTLCEGLLS